MVVLPLVALTIVEPPSRPPPEAGDRVGRHPQQQAARERGAAAAAAAPAERPGRPRDPDLGAKARGAHAAGAGRGTITRRARGSSRTVAGRSAMWSPSA